MKKLEETGYAIRIGYFSRYLPYFLIEPIDNFGCAKLVFEKKAQATAFNKKYNKPGKVVKVKVIEQ
jgi:hypothetical protein